MALPQDFRAGHGLGRNPVFLIWQLLHWLLFGCKNSQNIQKRLGDLFSKGQSGNAAGPNRRFHEPGPMGCRAVAPPNSVRLIHNL